MSTTGNVSGECGYCGKAICQTPWLPLECTKCHGLFHMDCLRGRKPPALMGDQLFLFTCAHCDPAGLEHCTRPNLQWVYVLQLVMYNLMMGRGGDGRKGFFRWNEDICGFIQTNWDTLMPHRKRTQSWHSTVAGALSVHCPEIFVSGFKEFGAHGWWSLASLTPPDARVVLPGLVEGRAPAKRSSVQPTDAKRARLTDDKPTKRTQTDRLPVINPIKRKLPFPLGSLQPLPLPTANALAPLQESQETILREHLERYPQAVKACPKAARLLRKLNVRAQQRKFGLKPFDVDESVRHSLTQTVKYIIDPSKPHYEQICPVLLDPPSPEHMEIPETCDGLPPGDRDDVLSRLALSPILSRPLPHHPVSLTQHLMGEGGHCTSVTSPYTARVLKPYILSTSDLRPQKVQVLQEVVEHYRTKHGPTAEVPEYTEKTVDLCYLQEHHLKAVNSLVSQFFWPVNLSECLLYPDFTVVALYGNLVVGCGFMTPDVKVNEAYLSFLLTHPDFSRAGIGRLMLYHLTQTCMGKDITLHVSIDNPAMILYQRFGFKAEQYCLDFYQRYFPTDHHLSHHAYLMRLRR